jgi:hypothetical protein
MQCWLEAAVAAELLMSMPQLGTAASFNNSCPCWCCSCWLGLAHVAVVHMGLRAQADTVQLLLLLLLLLPLPPCRLAAAGCGMLPAPITFRATTADPPDRPPSAECGLLWHLV